MKDLAMETLIEILRERVGVPSDFISGAIYVGGYNVKSLEAVLYYYTGYNSFDQYLNEDEDDL